MWEARNADGLDGLRAVVAEASAEQLALAKKAQEFPKDVQTQNDLGASETNLLLLRDELQRMSSSNEISVREGEEILEISESASAAEAYNRIYAEALPIARNGDSTLLDIYFTAIEDQLREAETEKSYAVAENRPDAPQKEALFLAAFIDYEASLDAKVDVQAAADQELLLPETVLTEDEEDALMFPIDTSRQTEGGQDDIVYKLMQLFDTVTLAEAALALDSNNQELQTVLSRAWKEYNFTKIYADSTAADQAGLTEEERQAIVDQQEQQASGDDGVEEVPLSDADAEALAAEIEKQR